MRGCPREAGRSFPFGSHGRPPCGFLDCATTAMSRLEEQTPEDDSGAETQANFFYQHCCAASWCVRTLGDNPTVAKVICETFDDFVVVWTNGASELVAVKHREGRTWTVAGLLSAGVLGGLLDRWQLLGEESTCRFMTNADLASGTDEASGLRECCLDGDAVKRRAWAERLAPRLRAEVEAMERFLSVLSFDRRPGREHIVPNEAVALRSHLRKLGVSDPYDERYFTAVAERIARSCRGGATRSRARGPAALHPSQASAGGSYD